VAERITVVGVGPDGPVAPEVLAGAELVVGGRRHLQALAIDGPCHVLDGDVDGALDRVDAADGPVVVLASGDPGFFGIVRALAERFGRAALDVRPAVSSVALVCARAGVPWDDAVVVSAHGRDPAPAVAACAAASKVVVLTEPRFGPAELARALADRDVTDRVLVIGERLGGPAERVRELEVAAAAGADFEDPNVVLVLDPARVIGPRPSRAGVSVPAGGWALPTDRFAHRDGMISKPEVRALALAHLAPAPGRTVWDVGAGSGAVAVECARFGADVHAVECDPAQVAFVQRNATEAGVRVRVVAGEAPAALGTLPDADAAFVGGGGAALPAILEAVAARTTDRLVVALATVERAGPAVAQLRDTGWDAAAQLVQVSDLAPLGDGHRLVPRNPVVLVLAEHP
jgi:precorrin-6Y C5,15-methyltransferase (decarboxylating)